MVPVALSTASFAGHMERARSHGTEVSLGPDFYGSSCVASTREWPNRSTPFGPAGSLGAE